MAIRVTEFFGRLEKTESSRWLRMALTCIAVISVSGCSDGSATPEVMKKLVPVHGNLTFNGQPAPGAVLSLKPADGSSDPANGFTSAVVGPDGKFEIRTSLARSIGEGAVPGDYVVAVSWVKPLKPNESDGDSTPELLPARYQDPNASPLKIKVEPGSNELLALDLTP